MVTRTFAALLVLTVAALGGGTPRAWSAPAADRAGMCITSGEPGNVFLADQTVRLRVAGADARASIALSDYDGKQISLPQRLVGPTGDLELGTLPEGYYELTVSDGGQCVVTPVVVVSKPARQSAARIAVDAACAWALKPEQYADGAELLRRAGFTWIRERITWGEVEPQRGAFRWGRYDAWADAASQRGIHIYQVFHGVPHWARADGVTMRYPDDLRDVYRFAQEAARHYRGRVRVWEPWDEADAFGYSLDTAAEHAAYMKAAGLGLRAGDPDVRLTQVSLAMASPRFHENLYRNGTPAYFDVFNYHIYDDPATYPARARGHFAVMDRSRVGRVPVWLTEAGLPLPAPGGIPSDADRRRQAEFIPKSCVMSLAAGTDRHFFFVFPHWLESGAEFGVLGADLRPSPGYAALATAVRMLGNAAYRGRLMLPGLPDVEARLFADDGETLVLWAKGGPGQVPLPAGAGRLRVFDCVGAQKPIVGASLAVNSSPLYVRAAHGTFTGLVPDGMGRGAAGPLARSAGGNLVVRVRPPSSAIRKNADAYALPPGTPTPVELQVYNFGAEPARCTLSLSLPPTWRVSPRRFDLEVAPMGRWVGSSAITLPQDADPVAGGVLEANVTLRAAHHDVAERATAVLDLVADPECVPTVGRLPIVPDQPDAWNWQDGGPDRQGMRRSPDPEGGVDFDVQFPDPGYNPVYPTAAIADTRTWRGYPALAFEYATGDDVPDTWTRAILVKRNGSAYYTDQGFPATRGWRRAVVPFDWLVPGAFAPSDPEGHLDPDDVALLRIGCHSTRGRVKFRLRRVELVRFR